MEEKVLALHPAGKQGTRISKQKYDAVRAAILAILAEREEILFKELATAVDAYLAAHLDTPFEGSIGWYTTTVKLDLEARGLIERVPKRSPQVLRLAAG